MKPIQAINNTTIDLSVADKNWRAELELGFSVKADRTILRKRRSVGPLVIQRPFYPEDSVCHVYVLHPPGGIVGGDKLTTTINVDDGANVLLTTPGASKLYRSKKVFSAQKNYLNVNTGSLEWFPQECISFSGAHGVNRTKVCLHRQARFIGWEILCLGRPAANEVFEKGKVSMRFDIWRDDKPLLLDYLKITGADELLTAPWGLRSYPCNATFIAVGVNQLLMETLRKKVTLKSDAIAGMTRIEDVLICRFLGHQAEHAKEYFTQLWRHLREAVIGKTICEPRIWGT